MKKQRLGVSLESLNDSKFAPMNKMAMATITGGQIYRSGGGSVGGSQYSYDVVTTYENGTIDREYCKADGSIAAPGNCS